MLLIELHYCYRAEIMLQEFRQIKITTLHTLVVVVVVVVVVVNNNNNNKQLFQRCNN